MSRDGLRCPDLHCFVCVVRKLRVGTKQIPSSVEIHFSSFVQVFVGGVCVARSKTVLLMVFLSWYTFVLSECVAWGAGDEARERGQTSTHTHTHTLSSSSSSAFLPLASFYSCFSKVTQQK